MASLNKGEMPHIVELIHKTMDGDSINVSSLTKIEHDYVKTTKVLLAQILYSHAWLET